MYQQASEKGKNKFVLHSFPGQKLISSVAGTVDRGQHRMNEIQYRVLDNNLYEVDAAGVHVARGLVTGTERCIFTDDGTNLIIVSDLIYVYNSFTGSFTENTNVNLVGTISATFINSQIIYTTPDLSFISQPNDPFDVSGLDGIGAESSPDKLVRDYVFNQTIYRMGVRTTEPWYNTGTGSPPIDRIDGQEFSVGVGAIHSVTNTDRALYWLGDDKAIYRVSGGIYERISDDGISNSIEQMTKFDDAFGYAFTLQGQDFYLITFPSDDRTFVINETLGEFGWFELESGLKGGAYSGTSLLQVYDKNIIAKGGELLELSLDEYTQNTDTMIRTRVTQSINGALLGDEGHEVEMSRMEFIMEQGVGLISGQGEVPRMMIEASFDGGNSWPAKDWVDLGRMGQNSLRVEWFNFDVFTDMILRLTLSDPVAFSIHSAKIDLQLVGR
jgi:hypothetical protein